MFSLYKTLHPSTCIDHSVYCNFLTANEQNLVVTSGNHLHVYRLLNDQSHRKLKFEHLCSFTLFGNVDQLAWCRYGSMTKDALILAFMNARISIVEYNQSTGDLNTLSIHYFDNELEDEGIQYNLHHPILRVDPNMRCAVMLIFGCKLVVLPFVDSAPVNNESQDQQKLSLSSYVIDLRKQDACLSQRIIDIDFLFGYYEPTLYILCESNLTWIGRYAVRKDTCNSVAMSLNIQQRTNPIVWPVDKLPSDCFKCIPVPPPIGGVLILAINSLIYLNQSVPSYGVSLNSIAKTTSKYPYKSMESTRITLECCSTSFLAPDRLILSLKGGEIYLLSIITDSDSLRTVRGFNFEKGPGSVISSCITRCCDGYLFIGSRLANSVLLKYSMKQQNGDLPNGDEIIVKETNQVVYKSDELDEILDISEEDTHLNKNIISYTFEICDILLNVAPCGYSIVGESSGEYSYFDTNRAHIDLVTSSGYAKNGAISVLQRSIRPEILTSFDIPDLVDMWSISVPNDESFSQTYLFLSKLDSTIVLQIGNEITELETNLFNTSSATLNVGNLSDFIVQITEKELLMYGQDQILQKDHFNYESPIKHTHIQHPFVGILLENGYFELFELENGRLIKLTHLTDIACFCLFTDESGIFSQNQADVESHPESMMMMMMNQSSMKFDDSSMNNITVDDEDELLYGTSNDIDTSIENIKLKKEPQQQEQEKQPHEQQPKAQAESPKIKANWLYAITNENALQIYEIKSPEGLELMFKSLKFSFGFKTLYHTHAPTAVSSINLARSTSSLTNDTNTNPICHEILALSFKQENSRSYLIARVDEEIIIYEAFHYFDVASPLKIRFKRLKHEICIRDRRKKRQNALKLKHKSILHAIDNVASHSGFFISGLYPYFVFHCQRSGLVSHPFWLDQSITSFVPLKNSSITLNGFIYLNEKSSIRICSLTQDDFNGKLQVYYDSPWILRKIQLRQTVHFIAYHEESKTYAVVTSATEPNKQLVIIGGDEKDVETFERDENFIYPQKDIFSIQLYTSHTWETLPLGKFTLSEWEHVTSFKVVRLPYEGHTSGYRAYLAASTSYVYGEDVNIRGKIFIYDVIETVPEPGQPLTHTKIKTIYDKDQKGPVSCLDSIGGLLVAAIGQKVFLYEFKNNDLIGRAFVDIPFYAHKMSVLKNFLLIADLHRSISLLRYQEEYKKLTLVAKDKHPMDTYACEFLVDNTNLAFLATDIQKNLTIHMFTNESYDNQGGQWLMRKAEFNVGAHVNSLFRLKCYVVDPQADKRSMLAEKRQVTYLTTLDGSIGYVLPVTEKTFRRLFMLQNALTFNIPHYAALNPKAFRAFKNTRKELNNPQKNILDGDLLFKFNELSFQDRQEISRKIKTSTDQILEDLTEIQQYSEHF